MFSKKLTLVGVACATLAAALPASATSLTKLDVNDMVQKASVCVIAKAVQSEFVQSDDGVYTRTTFQVSETAFGSAGATITVRTPGGELTKSSIPMAEVNPGVPRLLNGLESLLLLEAAGAGGDYRIVGYSQGIFNVVMTDNGRRVQLPTSEGGAMSVEGAVELMRARRTDGPLNETAQ